MYQYQYCTAEELIRLTKEYKLKISEIAVLHEAERQETDTTFIIQQMQKTLEVMKTNIQSGTVSIQPSIGGLIGKNAVAMNDYVRKKNTIGGEVLSKAIAYALAITEENARMKKIAACPTAGASGVVPGCLMAVYEQRKLPKPALIDALFNASAIGIIIADNATISGAEGGCQAEVGAASAMAASALVEMGGGGVDACFNAAAIALKNVLGLVCDPVAGLVEVPCSKRNAMGVANAIAAADMACAGIKSVIPLDEVVQAMKEVGMALPLELKETAKGGVANSWTAKELHKKIEKCTKEYLGNH